MSQRVERLLLLVILLFNLALGAGYAALTPAWETPDEPAHYNYIRYVAGQGALPVLQVGDYNADELERLKAAKFPASMPVDGVRYEFHQPPLYYVLMAPLYAATTGLPLATQVVALRLVSVLLGTLTLLLAYAMARLLFPKDARVRLGAPALLAAIPMHTAMNAAINNDPLAEALLAAIALLCLLRLQGRADGRRYIVAAGLLLGAGILTKQTVYVGAVLFFFAEAGRWWNRVRFTAEPVAALAAIAAVSLAIGGWWFVRNAVAYGNLDVLGRQRHDLVVTGQARTVLGWDALGHFAQTAFNSFWAQFGWMGILVDQRLYQALAVACALALAGLAMWVARRWGPLPSESRWGLALLALLFALIFGGMAQYNLDYIQPQGRYLFPAAVTVAVALALGLSEMGETRWLGPALLVAGAVALWALGVGRVPAGALAGVAVVQAACARWKVAWGRWLPLGVAVALGWAFNVYCLLGVIVPYFG